MTDEMRRVTEPHALARRRLLVMGEAEYDKATYEAPEVLNDPETWVVNFDAALAGAVDSSILNKLMKQRRLRPDQLYLLSPYDDDYVLADKAEVAFSLRKFALFNSLCALLGASEVTVKRNDSMASLGRREAGATASRGPVTVKGNVSREVKEDVEQQLSVRTVFKPAEPRVDEALQLLDDHGLTDDSSMYGLVDLFRRGGVVTSQELVLKLTSEASREIKAAASLKIPAVLSMSATFNDLKTQTGEILVEMSVHFANVESAS